MEETAVGASHWGEASLTGRGRGDRRCSALYARAAVELDEDDEGRIEVNQGSTAAARDRAAAAGVDNNDADAAESVNGRLKAIIFQELADGVCDESLWMLSSGDLLFKADLGADSVWLEPTFSGTSVHVTTGVLLRCNGCRSCARGNFDWNESRSVARDSAQLLGLTSLGLLKSECLQRGFPS